MQTWSQVSSVAYRVTGELEFRWMLHDRGLYTVHKVPVRFQRCLTCMVAKQGPCGDNKATWLCRSRLTDASPGVDVQKGKTQAQSIPGWWQPRMLILNKQAHLMSDLAKGQPIPSPLLR